MFGMRLREYRLFYFFALFYLNALPYTIYWQNATEALPTFWFYNMFILPFLVLIFKRDNVVKNENLVEFIKVELINEFALTGIFVGILSFIWFKYYSWKKNFKTVTTVLEAAAIPSFRHSQPAINREISRVRRYQRALSVVAIKQKSSDTPVYMNGSAKKDHHKNGHMSKNGNGRRKMTQMEFLLCGTIFRDALRDTDIITYDGSRNQFILILPETTRLEALQTMDRLNKSTGGKVYREMTVGIGEFPEQGFIVADLVEMAIADMDQETQINSQALDTKANKNLN